MSFPIDRYLNVRNTISTLFDFGVVPIINENDTVSVEELRFGDNDTLAALVANLIDADEAEVEEQLRRLSQVRRLIQERGEEELPDGTLVSPDGFSPEHGPHEDGVSFDQQLVWDLFTNFIEAAEALGDIYSVNVFPQMKVWWDTYPNHIGHEQSDGCTRCHNRKMRTEDREQIRNDCELCHQILAEEEENPDLVTMMQSE